MYGGFYSSWAGSNPWMEFYSYNMATGTATVAGGVDAWLNTLGWCGRAGRGRQRLWHERQAYCYSCGLGCGQGRPGGSRRLCACVDRRNQNQYPNLHLLPLPAPGAAGSFTLLSYGCNMGAVSALSPANAVTQLYALPALPDMNWCAARASTGSSVVLPLTPKVGGGYVVEYAMFGGHMSLNNTYPDPGNPGATITWGGRTLRPRDSAHRECVPGRLARP